MTHRWCWYHRERHARYRADITYGSGKRRIVYCHDFGEVEREEGESPDRHVTYTPVSPLSDDPSIGDADDDTVTSPRGPGGA